MTPEKPCDRIVAAIASQARRRRRARGLTIVELMLAVMIASIVLAIGATGWNYYREKIKISTAIQDIAAISVGVQMMCEDDRACPAALPASLAKLDPWGKPYKYLALGGAGAIGAARKDRSLVPINSDFDLYSMGPDGTSSAPLTAQASHDDIIRANDGKFIGVAANY
ncbi:MAG: prepilin-type N-terminal cleavage/methylation domain-containing protein [Rubrivivax sp.]|nr:prepilin-type N-terminal cleavage/methylation domain-containing protein [Rubrivivax sp.]